MLIVLACKPLGPTPVPPELSGLSFEELQEKAATPTYDDLFRINDRYVGQVVYYLGHVDQVIDTGRDRYLLRANVTKGEFFWNDTVFLRYTGPRVLEGDTIAFVGTVVGLNTYTAAPGNRITIPDISVIKLKLVSKAEWKDQHTTLPVLPVPPRYSLDNPLAAGEMLIGSDDTKVRVIGINTDARQQVAEENIFNDPPAEGKRLFMILLEIANPAVADSIRVNDLSFKLVGDNRLVYTAFENKCGVIPNAIGGEIFGGGRLHGNVCFEIPEDEGSLVLIYEPGFGEESRRFLSLAYSGWTIEHLTYLV